MEQNRTLVQVVPCCSIMRRPLHNCKMEQKWNMSWISNILEQHMQQNFTYFNRICKWNKKWNKNIEQYGTHATNGSTIFVPFADTVPASCSVLFHINCRSAPCSIMFRLCFCLVVVHLATKTIAPKLQRKIYKLHRSNGNNTENQKHKHANMQTCKHVTKHVHCNAQTCELDFATWTCKSETCYANLQIWKRKCETYDANLQMWNLSRKPATLKPVTQTCKSETQTCKFETC